MSEISRISIIALAALAILLGPLTLVASADPGGPTSGRIIVEKKSKLVSTKSGTTGVTPLSDVYTDLGGVTATSTAGMQWGSNPFGEDVSGLTQSSTSAVITTIHAHGALVQHPDANAQNCYEGEQKWTPSITNSSNAFAGSGWGPYFSGFHDCWVMATGHYYVYNGVRTDVYEPDIIKRF
jgi:hypothetical protein